MIAHGHAHSHLSIPTELCPTARVSELTWCVLPTTTRVQETCPLHLWVSTTNMSIIFINILLATNYYEVDAVLGMRILPRKKRTKQLVQRPRSGGMLSGTVTAQPGGNAPK